MVGKGKKVKASELLLKLREAVIKLVSQVKELKAGLDTLNVRVSNLEKRVVTIENKLSSVAPVARKAGAPTSPKREEDQLDLLAKELGLEVGLESEPVSSDIPAPPPPPSIERVQPSKSEKLGLEPLKPELPSVSSPEPIKSEELLGMESIDKSELDKDKDDLLKALKELDEL